MNSSVNILMYISCVAFFLLGIVTELMGYNRLSCWMVSTIIPKLSKRFKRKNTKFLNFLNFCSLLFFAFIIIYLMANLLYFGIWGSKFWNRYEILLYPTILIYLLIEAYLSFIINGSYYSVRG